MLQAHRREKLVLRQHRLRAAQEEEAVVLQPEVELRQRPRLRLAVEIHQRVAAEDQVQVRDGRVVAYVVPAEDHRVAHVAPQGVGIARLLEIFLEQRRRDRRDGLRGEGRAPRRAEGFLVHVRGVDFDAVVEFRLAQRLGQHHRERVRLLSGGAAGAPRADALRRLAGRQDLRDDFRAQEIPRRRVPEEGRDVDQDGVEEQREFLRVRVEVVAVLAQTLDPRVRHPLADPPIEAGPLVAGEIEAAVVPDVLQQRLQVARAFTLAHAVSLS